MKYTRMRARVCAQHQRAEPAVASATRAADAAPPSAATHKTWRRPLKRSRNTRRCAGARVAMQPCKARAAGAERGRMSTVTRRCSGRAGVTQWHHYTGLIETELFMGFETETSVLRRAGNGGRRMRRRIVIVNQMREPARVFKFKAENKGRQQCLPDNTNHCPAPRPSAAAAANALTPACAAAAAHLCRRHA